MSAHSAGRFDVRVQPAARRALTERLPEAVAAAVLDFLDGPLAENPLRVGKPLAGPLAGCLGARRGTYHVIYRVDLERRTVQVLDIDHRSKVDTTVRDRLAVLARERGTTMGALLAEATDALERQAFFARAQEQLERLRHDDPDGWSAYRAESHAWQAGTDRDTLSSGDEPGWWE